VWPSVLILPAEATLRVSCPRSLRRNGDENGTTRLQDDIKPEHVHRREHTIRVVCWRVRRRRKQCYGHSSSPCASFGDYLPNQRDCPYRHIAAVFRVCLVAAGSDELTTANPVSDILAALDSQTCLTLSFVGAAEHAVSCVPDPAIQTKTPSSSAAVLESVPTDEVSRAILVKCKYKDVIMRDPAVLGMAVGLSETRHGRASILIFLQRGQVLSKTAPSTLDGFEARIVPTGRIRAQSRTERKDCRFGTRGSFRTEP
jgi:hypothetical protein